MGIVLRLQEIAEDRATPAEEKNSLTSVMQCRGSALSIALCQVFDPR